MFNLNSLKFKIAIITFLLISIIMTATTWRDIKLTEDKLLNSQKEKTVLLSDRIAHGIMVLMLKSRWKDLQTMMESLVKDSEELKEIRIFLPDDGTIVVSSNPADIGRKVYDEDFEKYREGNHFEPFMIKKDDMVYASKLTIIKNNLACHKCHGAEKDVLGVMDVELSLSKVHSDIKDFEREHFTDAFIGFLLIMGTFLFIIAILIDRPFNRMVRTIKQIEKGDLSARMNIKSKDEIGLLATSFDNMVEALESARHELEQTHEQQMERAAKLATIGEVVAGIAHEIKNPLTGISCAVQLLQADLSEDSSQKVVTDKILSQVKRLDRTVKDLLSYAKPKAAHFLPYNINEVIDRAVFLVYPEAKSLNVKINTEIEEGLPDIIMDPDQMQQVSLNLMINSLQAMPEGGELTIKAYQLDYDKLEDPLKKELSRGSKLVVSFEDTGKGISSEDMEYIFEPFFTRKSKGSGLGLSITRKIIREHGGVLTCESKLGKGSLFTIYLPISKQ
ncbi:MAG: HAMP domain-containing protein [Nitrospirae bacterium]|nr:HAMP domain-containing protein [Nitrospirota bacterium]